MKNFIAMSFLCLSLLLCSACANHDDSAAQTSQLPWSRPVGWENEKLLSCKDLTNPKNKKNVVNSDSKYDSIPILHIKLE